MKKLTARQRAYLSVIGSFLLTSGGGIASTTSVFYLPVTAELGFTQASFAAYVAIMSWCGAISNPILGRVFSKFLKQIKLIIVSAGVFGFLCTVLLSKSSTLTQFYLIGAAMSFLLPFISSLLGVTIVSRWFETNQSIAISLVAIGTSAGTIVYSQVTSRVIAAYGWRIGYLAFGLMLLVCLGLAGLLVSPPPEYYGLKPLGYREKEVKSSTLDSSARIRNTLHSSSFIWICLSALVGCIYVLSVQQAIIPMFQIDYAMTPAQAATVLSVYSIICACGKPLMGWIYKRFDKLVSILYVGILVSASSLILCVSKQPSIAIFGICLIAIGNMFGTVLLPTLVSDLFGAEIFPAIMGNVNIFFTIGAGIGPLIIGRVFDVTGSYRTAFLLICITSLLTCAFLLFSVRSSRKKHRLKPKTSKQ